MKRWRGLAIAALALAGTAGMYAQSCGFLSDEAGVIKDQSSLQQAASGLVDQGADIHIVTVANLAKYGTRLADVAKAYKTHCPNWSAEDGHVKPNLFLLVVAPSARLKNAFFGASYTNIFKNAESVDSLYSQSANPFFKHGDYQGGLAAALRDFGSGVNAYHDQQKHPIQNTTTVTQQATDLKPVASVFSIFLILLAIAGVVTLVTILLRRRSASKAELEQAQQEAIAARDAATTAFNMADSSSPAYAAVAQQYSNLSNSVSYDPNASGLSAASYRSIKRAWNNVSDDLRALCVPSSRTASYADSESEAPRVKTATASSSRHHHHTSSVPSYTTPQPSSYPVASSPTVIHETHYVENNSGNDFLTGMVVGDMLSERRDRNYDEPRYSEPAPSYREPEHSSGRGSDSTWDTSSRSDDDFSSNSSSSGNDSSWSSSDSSTSFDSSPSPDFGSSDSGSGGDSSW